MEDVAFTFDPQPFLTAMEKLNGGLDNFVSNTSKMGTQASGHVQKVEMSALALGKALLPIIIIVKAIQKLIQSLPEIGRTFAIVGEIFNNNLIYPLRQELIPLLEKLLGWFRDNRALFLRIGNAIASVFRLVMEVVKNLITLLRDMWDKLFNGLQDIFGRTTKNIEDMVNLMIFKISALVIYIMTIIRPVAMFLVDVILQISKYMQTFFQGFMTGFGSMSPVLDSLKASFSDILGLMRELQVNGNAITNVFRSLGIVIGALVKGALVALVQSLDTVVMGISRAILGVQRIVALRRGESMDDLREKEREIMEGYVDRTRDRGGMIADTTQSAGRNTAQTMIVDNTQSAGRNVAQTWQTDPANVNNQTNVGGTDQSTTNNIDIHINVESTNASPQEIGEKVEDAIENTLIEGRRRSGGY